jgi:ssDNA-binding Zn-finger/Zn-ribbon topoisomerase 1
MSAFNFEQLKHHLGHNIVCVGYAKRDKNGKRIGEYENIAIECEDCNEVLLDFDADLYVCSRCGKEAVKGTREQTRDFVYADICIKCQKKENAN